ncbi:MAG: glycine cleavage system protein R [Candidatus Melainabacteria bacterium]
MAQQQVIITGAGPDHPGIVAELTGLLSRHGCNIEDTSMTILGSHFAMLILATLPDDITAETLRPDLSAVEKKAGIELALYPAGQQNQPVASGSRLPYLITVSGNDRTGITAEAARLLADHQVNITDLNAQVIPGEEGPVYILMMESLVPDTLPISELQNVLKALGQRLGVETRCSPMEALSL